MIRFKSAIIRSEIFSLTLSILIEYSVIYIVVRFFFNEERPLSIALLSLFIIHAIIFFSALLDAGRMFLVYWLDRNERVQQIASALEENEIPISSRIHQDAPEYFELIAVSDAAPLKARLFASRTTGELSGLKAAGSYGQSFIYAMTLGRALERYSSLHAGLGAATASPIGTDDDPAGLRIEND